MHLIEPQAWALEVGSSGVDPGAGLLPGIDVVLDSEIPEAIQIAAALTSGSDAFLTNDRALKRVQELPILVVDDLEL